jgi:hypothetical protein
MTVALHIVATVILTFLGFYAARDWVSAGYVTRPNISAVCWVVVAWAAVVAILWMTK